MSSEFVQFTFLGDEVESRATRYEKGMMNRFLGRAAEIAARNAPKDTRFMAENIVAVTEGRAHAASSSRRRSKSGGVVVRESVSVPNMPSGTGAVVGLADYTDVVERRFGMIRGGITQAQSELPAIHALAREEAGLGD